jgi:hypothetical protein
MAIPSVSLPVPFDQIPAEVKRLEGHIKGLIGETRVAGSLLQAVRECCPHPQDQQESWSDYGGFHNVRCKHCGREY